MSAPLRPTVVVQQAQPEVVAPPPQDSTLVRNVAIILASGMSITAMAAGIEHLLKPYGIMASSIMAAIGLSSDTTHKPRALLAPHGITPREPAAELPRSAARSELYYRAGYVINASRRIQEKVSDGKTVGVALSGEKRHYEQHKKARRTRLDAAARVANAGALYGPILGWYLDPLLNNEAECIAADGHNFHVEDGTIIGWPGAVHANCGCHAGPPHEGAGMVNDALRGVILQMPKRAVNARVFKLRRTG